MFYLFPIKIQKSGRLLAIRTRPLPINLLCTGTHHSGGGSVISTRDLTGINDSESREYTWNTDEIALVSAIMSAAINDTAAWGSPPSPTKTETLRSSH